MTRDDDLLERLAPLSGAPSRGFDDLLRLRAKRQLAQKIGVIAVVTALIATLGIGIATVGDRTGQPADPPGESHPPRFTGMVITHERHLAAQEPSTGESIALLDAAADPALDRQVTRAAASADGRWVAFELPFCTGDGRTGLWVTDGASEPRQLTAPCVGSSDDPEVDGRWAWSPTGSRLAAIEGDHLILIDPATGDRTELGRPAGDVTALAWSPDGTQVAYATMVGSVYRVSVEGGEHAVIAESLGQVPGGEEDPGSSGRPMARTSRSSPTRMGPGIREARCTS